MKVHFLKDHLNVWQPSTYEGHKALDIHARYFTIRRHAPDEQNLAFGDGIDPSGILSELRGHDLIHTMDNKVEYLKRQDKDDGKIR